MSHPREAEFDQIRTWIHSQAAGRSLEQIRDSVVTKVEALFDAVGAIPGERLAEIPAGDSWAPIDAFKHAVEWNWQVGEDVLHVALMGERPGNPPPAFEADRDLLIRRQRESLDSIWAHVSEADPGGFLEIRWEHPFFGNLNWREWYLFLGVHAIDHTGQIREMGTALSA